MINLLEVMESVKEIAQETGRLQRENLGRTDLQIATKKTDIDLVTEIDRKSEQLIVAFITKHYPEHGILAEESGRNAKESDFLWIIDPLDGTGNYIQGLPIFAVSIALQYKGETLLGAVYAPMTAQLFTAIRGQGAYLDNRRIFVSTKTKLIESVLATGFPCDIAENPVNNLSYFCEFALKTRAIRRLGAASYDLACVAAGQFDGYWELNLSPWDVAAASLLVEEAGGRIVNFREDRGISIIAGNDVICRCLHEGIQKIDREA
ncbi:MAG: inositol monophosphatase family protein [Negativicutes bacterium]|nr:inositol monophosphatase family protein [Negativicutes bacterium]